MKGTENRRGKLYLSDHPHSLGLVGEVVALAVREKDLAVVCDEGLASLVRVTGAEAIPVKVAGKRIWQRIGGAKKPDEKVMEAREVVGKVVNKLEGGGSVFVAPAGDSGEDKPWQVGIALVTWRLFREGGLERVNLSFLTAGAWGFQEGQMGRLDEYVERQNINLGGDLRKVAAKMEEGYRKWRMELRLARGSGWGGRLSLDT